MMEKRPTGVTAFPVAMRPPATRSRNGTFDPVDEFEHGDGVPTAHDEDDLTRLVDLDDVT